MDYKCQIVKLKVEMVRKKYSLNGKSCVNLDLLVNKERKLRLIDEYNLIDRLPFNMRNEVFNNIKHTMSKKIPLFKDLNIEIFSEFFKRMKLLGYADTEEIVAIDSKIEGFWIVNTGKICFRDNYLKK